MLKTNKRIHFEEVRWKAAPLAVTAGLEIKSFKKEGRLCAHIMTP